MEQKKERTRIAILLVCTAALVALILFVGFSLSRAIRQNEETAWVLRSYGNGVALYNGKDLSAVYGNIVLDDLPPEDVALLNSGISFASREEAERAMEDYDG